MFNVNFKFLEGLHQPAPRYTSYPTALEWEASDESPILLAFEKLRKSPQPLSLYFHIPFCQSMCLYCACSVVLNRREDIVEAYIDTLIQEMELVIQNIGNKPQVSRVHFGGGTPSRLSRELFLKLFDKLHKLFDLSHTEEIAIEIDPRSLRNDIEKAKFFQELGFNRVSLGIQDTQATVQEAVKRRQSHEESLKVYEKFKELGFESINIDLIYGLPKQTKETFGKTIQDILVMRPDRLALFSFASVPWIKLHQKAMKASDMPSMEEKFAIYSQSRHLLTQAGYQAIGMDHFSLPHDPLTFAFKNKSLIRNFQGYSLPPEEDLLGLGMTSTSFIRGIYLQNTKTLEEYHKTVLSGTFPVIKSKILSEDDRIRKWVIHKLMCTFSLEKQEFSSLFGCEFDTYFIESQDRLISMETTGLIHNNTFALKVTPLGELFVRVIATAFDRYFLDKVSKTQCFSASI
ncbi:Oxygen-independent coproporphyrinogen-III oxidase,coproporphyrinogen III oxidase,Putative heme iron utilization protein,oxygen-independent coproporphyrinogen III oxidase,HemN C-terminal region [Chlamydia serpentis]|uniref:Coproporphyrinogen-III oxidase n=1 Tax=Chlamydia serpentis TaxID=1967782 RepID=A0A2R8FC37_9CHLA|nr:oxygen-independent coproporphyrinogen III oxidase [Chlamydia serpentis]SPN73999.1 Oxygen-independent coproporphyrinogen-III oxidase,coproporphyrinogen III oxidase,Putative heme iron utilization protein,oxygen-independent coproporphyrinogen III oxidase,HemN C-terminal region [Chlamydia serpentis]